MKRKRIFQLETRFGEFRVRAYQQTNNKQVHLALTKGTWSKDEAILTRVNSTQVNNDILGTLTNNADKKLDQMFQVINEEGRGAILFINQQNQSQNLLGRLGLLKENQANGQLKAPAIGMDNRDFGIGAQILHDIHVSKLKLVTNTKQTKRVGMIGYGLEIIDYVAY